jgi:hypothetical protein
MRSSSEVASVVEGSQRPTPTSTETGQLPSSKEQGSIHIDSTFSNAISRWFYPSKGCLFRSIVHQKFWGRHERSGVQCKVSWAELKSPGQLGLHLIK